MKNFPFHSSYWAHSSILLYPSKSQWVRCLWSVLCLLESISPHLPFNFFQLLFYFSSVNLEWQVAVLTHTLIVMRSVVSWFHLSWCGLSFKWWRVICHWIVVVFKFLFHASRWFLFDFQFLRVYFQCCCGVPDFLSGALASA